MEIVSPTYLRVLRATAVQSLGAALLALAAFTVPVEAVSYDASLFLSIAAGQRVPFGTSLTLFPGITVTPPPVTFGNAGATRSATASVPGQVFVTAAGGVFVCDPFPFTCGGEQPSFSIASSGASATGVGSLVVLPQFHPNNVNFPIVIQEDWSIFASSVSGPGKQAEASIRYSVLFDGNVLRSGNRTVEGGFAESHIATPLTLNVPPASILWCSQPRRADWPRYQNRLRFFSSVLALPASASPRGSGGGPVHLPDSYAPSPCQGFLHPFGQRRSRYRAATKVGSGMAPVDPSFPRCRGRRTRWGGQSSVRAGDLEEAQKELRGFLTAMARRQSYAVTAEQVDWTFMQVEDARRLPKSGKPPRPGARWPGRISRSYRAPVPVAIVLHAADLLDFVKAERLIACPFIGKEGPCPKIFLASRRQRYCSEEHSKKAAWLAWLKREGGSRAKNVPANVPASTWNQPKSTPPQPRAKKKTPR